MSLSKSQYIRGLQCHKSLWLYKNSPELRETPSGSQESLFDTGNTVGDYAKKLFPNGVEIEFAPNDYNLMITQTKELIDNGCEVIYEATFREGGVFAMVDILVKNGDSWDIYEVKASTSVKDYQINDVSVQWYALSQVLKLNQAFVVHVDNSYVRNGEIEPDKLFYKEDVTDIVKELVDSVSNEIQTLEDMLRGDEPRIDIGGHCSDPFWCDFSSHCWAHIPAPSIFDLYRMNGAKKFEMYNDGVVKFEDITDEYVLNQTQQLQVQTYLKDTLHVDKQIISEFLKTISYPINFFDFETYNEAIPRFNGVRPYMQIPFQYSLHILYKDGTLIHKEYLADETTDPRSEIAKKMLQDITNKGSIVAYNQSFEISRIKELAEFNDTMRDELLALNDRFVDLIVPFRTLGYYHKDFNGSFSIKSVLPAMFPNDDELDYKKLGCVQNGGDAMDTFASLHLLKDKNQRDSIRADLLAYCRLDTLAMVRIYEKLREICE